MEPTQPNSGSTPGAAAAAAVTPDSQTAALLEKHAAGVKLTSSEYGKIGAFAKWIRNPFAKGGGAAQSPGSPTSPGKPAALATMAASPPSADSLESVPVDDGLCQRTASAVLRRADAAAVSAVERRARAVADALGLDDEKTAKIVERFRASAALPNDDKKLIVELSPDVCRELGINPREFALATVGSVLLFHSINIWQAIDELKGMQKAKVTAPQPKPETKTDPSAPAAEPVPIKSGKIEPAPTQKIAEFPK